MWQDSGQKLAFYPTHIDLSSFNNVST